ncbi:hypothetical protein TDB9533_04236 [Thalassocella blandensis]|nr:hypothetical protein TDB9533_04236 [Thalassocella blandensis]
MIIATIVYPFLVFFGAKHWGAHFFQYALIFLAVFYFISARTGNALSWVWVGVCLVLCGWLLVSGDMLPAKLYPVAISIGLGTVFVWSLFYPPTVIERIARLQDPDLPEAGVVYTRQVTKVWIAFFCVNAIASASTSLFFSNEIWLLYNGFISYLLMGLLFVGEWLVRQNVQKKMKDGSN